MVGKDFQFIGVQVHGQHKTAKKVLSFCVRVFLGVLIMYPPLPVALCIWTYPFIKPIIDWFNAL